MSDDPTKELPSPAAFEAKVLEEFGVMREEFAAWESVQLAIQKLDLKFDRVIQELYELRADVGLHDKRLIELEAR